MIPIIFFVFLITWIILTLGLILNEEIIILIISFMLIIISIYLFQNGINGVNDLIITCFSFINIGVGFYLLIKIGLNMMK